MALVKHLSTLYWVTLLLLFSNPIYSQTYDLKSLEGKPEKIILNADYVNNRVIVAFRNDTSTITGTTGLDGNMETVGNYFLKITYRLRIGSGIKSRMTIFYCVKEQHLFEALNFLTEYRSDQDKTYNATADSLHLFDEHNFYNVHFEFSQDKNIKLNLKIHEENKSKAHPLENYVYDTKEVLVFDKKLGIFYNEKKKLHGNYTIIKIDNVHTI